MGPRKDTRTRVADPRTACLRSGPLEPAAGHDDEAERSGAGVAVVGRDLAV